MYYNVSMIISINDYVFNNEVMAMMKLMANREWQVVNVNAFCENDNVC